MRDCFSKRRNHPSTVRCGPHGIARANAIINSSLTREYLQHESNLVLQKFAEKGGASTLILPANMQAAPLIQVK